MTTTPIIQIDIIDVYFENGFRTIIMRLCKGHAYTCMCITLSKKCSMFLLIATFLLRCSNFDTYDRFVISKVVQLIFRAADMEYL